MPDADSVDLDGVTRVFDALAEEGELAIAYCERGKTIEALVHMRHITAALLILRNTRKLQVGAIDSFLKTLSPAVGDAPLFSSKQSCPRCGGELGTAIAIGLWVSDLHVCLQCAALVRVAPLGAYGVSVVDVDALALSPAERDAVHRAIEIVRRDLSRVNADKANR